MVRGLQRVTPVAGRNSQLTSLSHVLCRTKEGSLEFTCTDLEVGARTIVPGKVEEEGSCTVVARTLFDYIQQLPASQPVLFVQTGTKMEVTTEGFQASFPTGDADDFPLLPTISQERTVAIGGEKLSEMLSQVVYAAARDTTRPELHSVFMSGKGEEMWAAATDSFRLSEEIVPLEESIESFSFLLPLTATQEVIRLFLDQGKVSILPQESHVTFRGDDVEFTSRLVEGAYPDYRQIIPHTHQVEGVVEEAIFSRALKTLTVFLPRDSRRLKCVFSPPHSNLVMSVGGEKGEGVVTVPFVGKGESAEVFFNIQYLLDGVQHLPGTSCRIQCGGGGAPTVFTPVGETRKALYVVMPIQT